MLKFQRTAFRTLTLLIVAAMLLVGCSDDDDGIVDPPTGPATWEAHTGFELDHQILLTAMATEDMLYIPGWRAFNTIEADGNYTHYSNWGGGHLDIRIKPSATMHALPTTYDLWVRPNANPVTSYTDVIITSEEHLPGFQYWVRGQQNSGCFNDSGQLLMGYAYLIGGAYSTQGLFLADLELDQSFLGIDTVTLKSAQTIPLPTGGGSVFVRAMTSVGSSFLVVGDEGTCHLTASGTLTPVLDRIISNFFVDGDLVYGVTWNNELWRSQDAGLTWEAHGSMSPSSVQFAKIGERVACFVADRIYAVDLDEFSVMELETGVMDGATITGLAVFQDEVYAATLSGLYHRPVDTFFTPLEEGRKSGGLQLAP